jgi:hypothetical protein
MQISQFLDFCERVLLNYGNLEAVIYSDDDETSDFSLFTITDVQLIEIPVSRFGYKSRLALGISLGKDIRYEEDARIKGEQRKMPRHLFIVKNETTK